MKELALTTAIVILIDMSDLTSTVKKRLSRFIGKPVTSIKPFDCSFCLTIYTLITYHLFNDTLTAYTFCYTFLLAFATPIIAEALLTLKDLIIRLLKKI